MGWRGAVRAIAAAQRAAERESVRRHRQFERMSKEQAKRDAALWAASEVEEYENLIDRITSVHRDCSAPWKWQTLSATASPPPPRPTDAEELKALAALDAYSPSLIDKVFLLESKKRARLIANIDVARRSDAAVNATAQQAHAVSFTDWKETKDLADRILTGDPAAFRDAVDELSPFRELSDLGSNIAFQFARDTPATVTLTVNGDSVVPSESKSLLQSGKLSTKKISQVRFFELYQDYVSGAVLRIARELFALLPIDVVFVTAVGNMLDSSTGHMVNRPILSTMIPRETLDRLRFDTVEASEALRNFNHRVDFKKTKGFAPIEPLESPTSNKGTGLAR